jgi:transglutaminase-like putative cysteine protease
MTAICSAADRARLGALGFLYLAGAPEPGMHVRVGFEFTLESSAPTPTAAILRPRWYDGGFGRCDERHSVTPELLLRSYQDSFGNTVWRWTAPMGSMRLRYDAIAEVAPTADPVHMELPGTPVDELPDETLIYTLPSRYCPSDLVIADAWQLFGATAYSNISYGYGSSTATTSGYDAYQNRRGVCRDFAHIGVMFCRAMNIPARYVYGYLPDIGVPVDPNPMDFHAWFEAYIAGAWYTFDARHNTPRIGRVLIARGRDAVDTAILTSYGPSKLTGFTVWADEVDETVTLDDPLLQQEVFG